MGDNSKVWAPLEPKELTEFLEESGLTWWVAGGWAIDLFLDRQTRVHSDTDVGVLRCQSEALFELTRHFRPHLAADGQLWPWTSHSIPGHVNDIWLRNPEDGCWMLQLMVNPGTPETWVYRRDEVVAMPMKDALGHSAEVPYLKPHLQLLFKAKAPQPKDTADASEAVPHLDGSNREWLRTHLTNLYPTHSWLPLLD